MARENWLLEVIQNGITPTNEANTSRYVHEALMHCFGWPFESIHPQASKRGFIDYELKVPKSGIQFHVEVKPFRKGLNNEMIRRYLVRRGPEREDFRVGVLTNLARWQIFLAGPEVTKTAGTQLVCLLDTHASSRANIYSIRKLIGFRNNGQLSELRAASGDIPDVARHVLINDMKAINAVRQQLRKFRERAGMKINIPNFKPTARSIRQLTQDKDPSNLKFSVSLFQKAICSDEVARAINNRLVEGFGSRNRVNQIKKTLQGLFD
jgi:hypothetical protein